MSQLVGNYACAALNAKLQVTATNDSNGAVTGTFTIFGTTFNLAGAHYHIDNGPSNVVISGSQDNPNKYMAATCFGTFPSYPNLEIAGGYSDEKGAYSFSGTFVRI